MLYFSRVGSSWGHCAFFGSSWGKKIITPKRKIVGFFKLEFELSPNSLFVLRVYLKVEVEVHILFYVFVVLLFICVSD
jgi:hypothetical protein